MQPYIPVGPVTITFTSEDGVQTQYLRPAHLGAGRRKRIDNLKTIAVQKLPEWKARYDAIDFDDTDTATGEYTRLLMEFNLNYPEEGECAQLEALLTPCEGSPDVRTWYFDLSTKEQVQEQLDFLSGSAPSKTVTLEASPASNDTNSQKLQESQ